MNKKLIVTAIAGACLLGSAAASAADAFANTLTGDWGGTRQHLLDSGVNLGLSYVDDLGYNLDGGTSNQWGHANQIGLHGDFDFGKLWGWQGGSLHVDITNRNGNNVDRKADLGTLMETQEVYGAGNITRLVNLYVEQKFGDGVVDVKAGRMTMNVDFYQFSCNFLNLSFCSSLPGWISSDFGNWPMSQVGASLTVQPSPVWYAKVAAYKVNPNDRSPHDGFRFLPKGSDIGTVFLGEMGFHTSLGAGTGDSALTGTWSVGGWHSNAKHPDLLLDVDGLPQIMTGAATLMRNSDSGYYALGQQQVSRNGAGGGWSIFANLVQADANITPIDQMFSVGAFYQAPFASRPDDRIGLAFGRNHVSGRAADKQRIANAIGLGPVPIQTAEYVFEANYFAPVWRGVSLMPSIQYVRHPGGTASNDDAVVVGVQLALSF